MLIKVYYYSFFLVCNIFFLFIFTGSQWGWLPYDIAPTETLPFVCEVPIRETYGVSTSYRGIGKSRYVLVNINKTLFFFVFRIWPSIKY
jgi:hypothetical protein